MKGNENTKFDVLDWYVRLFGQIRVQVWCTGKIWRFGSYLRGDTWFVFRAKVFCKSTYSGVLSMTVYSPWLGDESASSVRGLDFISWVS